MAKTKLKWRSSYETYVYDTPDGDLDFGQYADDGEDYIVRKEPKDRWNTRRVDKSELDLTGLQKVNIISNQVACYSSFYLPDGTIIRVRDADDLLEKQRTIKDYAQPTKEVTEGELQRWQ